ncbi:uncharacterized protein LOC130789715 [Actinidia eriantha]|uniref:uncharacterized protein LOC130789715 n=1 Tax=Actinidia eriantha TaxID=165200 RepID=UPI002589B010|nr:uncharacterized protein LOC130789715 [Actinidia eriantha]
MPQPFYENESQQGRPVCSSLLSASSSPPFSIADGDLIPIQKEGKKEEEETALEGEFIKVEKEPLDTKDDSNYAATPPAEDEKTSVIERSSSNSTASRELLETQEKVKELELELEGVAGALKHSESANAVLKDEVSLTKAKLDESGKKLEELELNLTGFVTAGKARKFEELHKESSSHAESETKKALEFERLLEMAKLSVKEMEDQMASLQEELKGLYYKIAENQKVEEEALKSTAAELAQTMTFLIQHS